LGACGGLGGGGESAASAAEERPASSEPRYGGNMIMAMNVEPTTFNGLYARDSVSIDIGDLMFVGLMQPNERLEMEPRVAAGEPEVSDDGRIWTVRLREGIRFHDGVELTAHDVAFTYGVRLHSDFDGPSPAATSLIGVEALDDYTVRFTLQEPNAKFHTLLAVNILPRHLLEHVPVAELGEYRAFNVDRPIGAGPFKLVSWTPGQSLVVEAFDGYFEGRPYLDRITFRFTPNASTSLLLLETGEVDHLLVPITEVATVERMPHVTLYPRLRLLYAHIGWNLRNQLFTERRVRQALTHAIDREEIVATLLDGHGQVAHAPTSPLIEWAYTEDVPKFAYDPQRARALLAEVGWRPGADGILERDGRRFSFGLLTSPGFLVGPDLAVIVQQYLRAVGIDAVLEIIEFGAFGGRIRESDFDAVLNLNGLPTDPDPSPRWHSREIGTGGNPLGFSDARVDELADRNLRLLDRAQRAAVLHEIWRILAEEQPETLLYYDERFIALKSDVRGFVNHPARIIYRANEYWLDR
jgi:peptide/nickel transport system substrate-binding protein